jgi:hypothetical protein
MKTEASKFSVGSIKIDVGWSDGSSNIFTIENIVSQYEKGSFYPKFQWGKISNSVVIKLFINIVNESFFK